MPWLTLLIVAALVPCGCDGERRPRVVLYVSADEYVARQVVEAFETSTGVDVLIVGDTEAKKTTGLVQRLRAERDHPQADVFWSSEIFQTIALADADVLAPHRSEVTDAWPEEHRDAERRWYAFAARPRVIVYAPARLDPDEIPRTWMSLTQPEWRDRIVMADPRFGTTGGHLAAMRAYWERIVSAAYFEAFVSGLADNGTRLLPSGNAGVVQAVADGEADLGLTDADDVWAARARGLDVALVYPRHHVSDLQPGGGTLLIPNTVARVRGGPNPDAAARLIDFLLSEKVERMLAESVSHNVPLRPELAGAYPEFQVRDPLRVSYERAAALRAEAVDIAMRHLRDRETADAP
jgi:iron(III) transport system substrate-binding protein